MELGLVNACSLSPWQLCRNHQVLAYGYTLDGGGVTLHIYDPNYPNDDRAELRVDLSDPDGDGAVTHSCEGATVRGVFLTEYRRPTEAPAF